MARLMAHDSLIPPVIPCTAPVIPDLQPVIPGLQPVIPAKAGIQPYYEEQLSSTAALDTRLRGYDVIERGAGPVDPAEVGRAGV